MFMPVRSSSPSLADLIRPNPRASTRLTRGPKLSRLKQLFYQRLLFGQEFGSSFSISVGFKAPGRL